MKALFCTDASDISFYAIESALEFLKKDVQINILYVIDWGFFPATVAFTLEEEIFKSQKQNAKELLEKTKEIIESKGFNVAKIESLRGNPAEVIMEEIKNTDYDCVILGSHGKKGLYKWLGSVSAKIIMKSQIPVIIGRPDAETKKIAKGAVFAVDGSACSYNAAEKVFDILDITDKKISALTVIPGPESLPIEITMDNEWLAISLDKQKELAEEILGNTKKILEKNGVIAPELLTLTGNPASEIIDFLHQNPKGIIILGTHGREGLADIILGSVSKRILDHAQGLIVVIPAKK